jgi:hypothetical protein
LITTGSDAIFCACGLVELGSTSLTSGSVPTMKRARFETPPALRRRNSRSPGSAFRAMAMETRTSVADLVSRTRPVTPPPVTRTSSGASPVPVTVTSTVRPRWPPAG